MSKSAWRGVCQNSYTELVCQSTERKGKGDLIQQQVSEPENILSLDKTIQSLEARTGSRLAN